jgi:hypothetical protein
MGLKYIEVELLRKRRRLSRKVSERLSRLTKRAAVLAEEVGSFLLGRTTLS